MKKLLTCLSVLILLFVNLSMANTTITFNPSDNLFSFEWEQIHENDKYYIIYLKSSELSSPRRIYRTRRTILENVSPISTSQPFYIYIRSFDENRVELFKTDDYLIELSIIVEGEDYYLPDWVERSEYTGYARGYAFPEAFWHDGNQYYKSHWWRDLEPNEGEYAFDTYLQPFITSAIDSGYTIQLRIWGNSYGGQWNGNPISQAAPDWLFTGDPPILNDSFYHVTDNPSGGKIRVWHETPHPDNNYITYIRCWEDAVSQRYNAMIDTLGNWLHADSDRMNAIGSAYIHGISSSRGEEHTYWWLSADTLVSAGLTSEVATSWINNRMDAFANAFGDDHKYKVAWVGNLGSFRWFTSGDTNFRKMALDLFDSMWDKGLGYRAGNIERWFQKIDDPGFGSSVCDDGYVTIDESIPTISEIRYLGDENEGFTVDYQGGLGPIEHYPIRYRFSLLTSLQRHLRWLWTHCDAETLNVPLSNYWRLTAGKNINNSPDAWSYLSETPVSDHQVLSQRIRNIERWLYQRDFPNGGQTVPTDLVARDFLVTLHGTNIDNTAVDRHDWLSRRTDYINGEYYMYFNLDDRFDTTNEVIIKVEYRDEGTASWHIEYMNTDNILTQTSSIKNQNSEEIKTASFWLNDAEFNNGIDNNMDFRIVTEGPGDVTIRWVRLIRWLEEMLPNPLWIDNVDILLVGSDSDTLRTIVNVKASEVQEFSVMTSVRCNSEWDDWPRIFTDGEVEQFTAIWDLGETTSFVDCDSIFVRLYDSDNTVIDWQGLLIPPEFLPEPPIPAPDGIDVTVYPGIFIP